VGEASLFDHVIRVILCGRLAELPVPGQISHSVLVAPLVDQAADRLPGLAGIQVRGVGVGVGAARAAPGARGDRLKHGGRERPQRQPACDEGRPVAVRYPE
jgi:hypothetical protein